MCFFPFWRVGQLAGRTGIFNGVCVGFGVLMVMATGDYFIWQSPLRHADEISQDGLSEPWGSGWVTYSRQNQQHV